VNQVWFFLFAASSLSSGIGKRQLVEGHLRKELHNVCILKKLYESCERIQKTCLAKSVLKERRQVKAGGA